MFHSSTQCKFWTFSHEDELRNLRESVNKSCRQKLSTTHRNKSVDDDTFYVTTSEHCLLAEYYEKQLREFCWKFNPPMPLNTVSTACHYMKRLYLRKSVMEYHPRLMFLVCAWLACKTDEFNVSMDQFQQNVHWANKNFTNNSDIGEAVLTMELILIQELNFHLTIHNGFRPLEGFFIDVKTRFPSLNNPEPLRGYAKDFIVRSLSTDAILLFSPSQIALSALLSSASRRNLNIDRYVTDVILKDRPQEVLKETIQKIKKIRAIVKSADLRAYDQDKVDAAMKKLENCYNKVELLVLDQEDEFFSLGTGAKGLSFYHPGCHVQDPTTFEYVQLQQEIEQEKYEKQSKKRKIEKERTQKIETDLLGF